MKGRRAILLLDDLNARTGEEAGYAKWQKEAKKKEDRSTV